MNENIKFCIIIVHFNGSKDIIECLESLSKVGDSSFKVVIIDNASITEHIDSLKTYIKTLNDKLNIILIESGSNLGFAGGNNLGIKALMKESCNYFIILNPDTVVEPGFIFELEGFIKKNKNNNDMIAPRMMQYYHREKIDNLGITLTKSGIPFNRRNEKYNLLCPSGGCSIFSRNLLKDIMINDEYYDRDFFMYVEDVDLGTRARMKQYKCNYASNVVVYHKGSALMGALSKFTLSHNYRNTFLYWSKDFPLKVYVLYLPFILSMQLLTFLLAIKRGKGIVYLKSLFSFLKLRGKIRRKRKYIENKLSFIEYLKLFNNSIIINEIAKDAFTMELKVKR